MKTKDTTDGNVVRVPRYYKPWPHQQEAWNRFLSKEYNVDVLLFCRQAGKDQTHLQQQLYEGWTQPGTQAIYVGLDNVWIRNNIFEKTITHDDGVTRYNWADYPDDLIEAKDTKREVIFHNNPQGSAESRIRFIGMKNDAAAIGSSYSSWRISEMGLYPDKTFEFIWQIWESKKALGTPWTLGVNGTPRGAKGEYYNMMRRITGIDDPQSFPGEHVGTLGKSYVQLVTARDLLVPRQDGSIVRLYSDEQLENMRADCIRMMGNDNWFRQEWECAWTATNAGIVYQGIEILRQENRFTKLNVDPKLPVILAFDVAGAKKTTKKSDYTAVVVAQMNAAGQLMIIDYYQEMHVAVVEVLNRLQHKEWFRYVKRVILPWDTESYQTIRGPREEAEEAFGDRMKFYTLGQTRNVNNDIQIARTYIPNLWIDSTNCDLLMTAFMEYEYQWYEKQRDWSFSPKHNWASHGMDAFRYLCVGLKEMDYQKIDIAGKKKGKGKYTSVFDEPAFVTKKSPINMTEEEHDKWLRQQRGLDASRKWSF